MKRIVMFVMSTLTVLVLLFGYHTSTSSKATAASQFSAVAPIQAGTTTRSVPTTAAAGPTTAAPVPTTAAGSTSATSSATATSPATVAGSTTASSSSAAATVTGAAADTRWGPVQVQLTVENGKITNVDVVEYPNGNGKDQEINADALPILIQETLTAQNAQIDMVSGATVTSDGYVTSLQSALDQAGLT